MKEFEYVIKDPVGLHARPAGLLVKQASQFKSSVMVNVNGKEGDAKKLLQMMSLGIKQGTEIKCRIEGEDETEAYEAVYGFFKENL